MQTGATGGLAMVLLAIAVSASAQPAAPGRRGEPVEPTAAVLVLDASGSMWARLSGEIKMEIARSVVRDLVGSFGDRVDLGLVAYGHRRKGDCSDIETLVAPGRGSSAELLAAVEGVSPRGKTPLAAAIERAARDLGYRERRAVGTVVSDGRETCGNDPCAVASRLEADGVDFTAHVIGFDTTEEEGRELRCIASATGGQFARASSRAELVDALGRMLTRAAEPTGPATLVLSAALGEHEQPIFEGVRWTVTALDAASDAAAGPTVVEGVAEPLSLAPGRYDVRAEYRGSVIERHITLHGGETWRERVLFGPGQLALRAVLSEGAMPVTEPIAWSVHRVGAFGRVEDEPVHAERRSTCLVRLEAGHYEVRARLGETERRLRVELQAGVIQPHTVDLEAGEARVFATLPPPGGPFLDPVEWTIRPLDADGGRADPIVERRASSETFVLPAGRYHVTGRHGAFIGDAIVHVEAGRSEAIGIVLHGGTAPASAGSGSPEPPGRR